MKKHSTIFSDFLPLTAITTTAKGATILESLTKEIQGTLLLPEKLQNLNFEAQFYADSLAQKMAEIWSLNKAFLFCLATGAVVRLITPFLTNKHQDPAIIIIDPNGEYVISLLSGHGGGADQLTRLIASQINAIPIVTGASHHLELPPGDLLGLPYGWRKGSGDWNGVSGAIARQEPVEVIQETGSPLWQYHLPPKHSFFGLNNQSTAQKTEITSAEAKIWISAFKREFKEDEPIPQGQWHPRVLWVGIGCERNTPKSLIEEGLKRIFSEANLALEAIAALATIDLKQDEVGILELCQEYNLNLITLSSEELRQIEVPHPSAVVEQEVGTPSVAEASALGAIVRNQGQGKLIIPKQIIKKEGVKGAVTLAVAQSEREYLGKKGQIWLVGIGPGSLEQMTIAARNAIIKADVIIGYTLYLDLIKSLKRAGQIWENSPITQEKQRANRAIELAKWGLNVAVISSGDCGIYGMGGLVLEGLKNDNWNGKEPAIEILPGITALQAGSSRVGTPLMHDFCAISLSDLLNPWPMIEKRLICAAQGDFITGLYNPKSEKRTQQIIKTQEIFLQYRAPHTPVAIIKSAYRDQEEITITTLNKMLEFNLDMLTIVIIGNSTTYCHENWLITPRSFPHY